MPEWVNGLPGPVPALGLGAAVGLVGVLVVIATLFLSSTFLPDAVAKPVMNGVRAAGSALCILGPVILAYNEFEPPVGSAIAAGIGAVVTYHGLGLVVAGLWVGAIVTVMRV